MIILEEADGRVQSALMEDGGSMNPGGKAKADSEVKAEAPKSTGLLAAIQSGGSPRLEPAAAPDFDLADLDGGGERDADGLDDDMETSMI